MNAHKTGWLGLTGLAAVLLLVAGGCGRQGTGDADGSAAYPWDKTDLAAVLFVNAQTGVVAGAKQALFQTTDGGQTWFRRLPADERGDDFWGLYQTGTGTLWCASRGRILRSVDAGAAWTETLQPAGGFYYYGTCSAGGDRLFMLQPPTYGTKVYATPDGQGWDKLPGAMPRNDYGALFVLDDTHLWVGGANGLLARSVDGGSSWERLDLANGTGINQLQFINSQTGWARSVYSGVLATTDGGMNWTPLEIGSYATVDDMQWLDQDAGFLLLAIDTLRSRIQVTRDGGRTWTAYDQPALQDLCVPDREGPVYGVGSGGCFVRLQLQ